MTTGFCTFLGLVLDREQASVGISTHSSDGLRRGTNLVTCLHCLCGSKLQVSVGTYLEKRFSWMLDEIWVASFLSLNIDICQNDH